MFGEYLGIVDIVGVVFVGFVFVFVCGFVVDLKVWMGCVGICNMFVFVIVNFWYDCFWGWICCLGYVGVVYVWEFFWCGLCE